MAFVSQINRTGYGNGKKPLSQTLTIRKTPSGATGGYISLDTGLRGQSVDIQIDEDRKIIRIGKMDDGIKINSKQGSFSCSISVFNETGPGRIPLTDGGDGWWYGKYADEY